MTMRILTAFLPLALTPVLFFALAEGWVNLGGGEKDILMLVPWLLWSLIFATTALTLWWRRWALTRSLVCSAPVGTAGLLIAAAVLVISSTPGVAGR